MPIEFRAEFFTLFNHVNFANPFAISTPLHPAATSIRIRDRSSTSVISGVSATSNNPRLIICAEGQLLRAILL
jgi:hypothetical protein